MSSAAPLSLRKLDVDSSRPLGILKSLQGVSGAPRPPIKTAMEPTSFFDTWAPFLCYTGVDVSEGYKMARIDIVRTHDMPGAGDIDGRYVGEMPLADGTALDLSTLNSEVVFPDMSADPEDPASYNFGPTDDLVQSIVDIGADVIYRIGRTIRADSSPPDPEKYGAIVKHLVMHYNCGWADGFHHNIRYWELWNEPDYDFDLGFWSGTPEQFYELYAAIAKAVKSVDPMLEVGGPAISVSNDVQPFREGFMDYVCRNKLPLDFFSWHWYGIDSYDPIGFNVIAAELRRLLDERGLTDAKLFLDEWNGGIMLTEADLVSAAGRAAFMTSSVLYMQDSPIERSLYYNGYSPFGADGATPNEVGSAFIALGKLKDTPLRLALTGTDDKGFAAVAGTSEDGKLTQILISNFQIPDVYLVPRPGGDVISIPDQIAGGKITLLPRRELSYADNGGYSLSVRNLQSGSYRIERFQISDTGNMTELPAETGSGPLVSIEGALPPPGIELVRLIRE